MLLEPHPLQRPSQNKTGRLYNTTHKKKTLSRQGSKRHTTQQKHHSPLLTTTNSARKVLGMLQRTEPTDGGVAAGGGIRYQDTRTFRAADSPSKTLASEMSLTAAASTMFRMTNFLMALSLGTHRAQLVQRIGCTWPRPFLARPLFLLFLVCVRMKIPLRSNLPGLSPLPATFLAGHPKKAPLRSPVPPEIPPSREETYPLSILPLQSRLSTLPAISESAPLSLHPAPYYSPRVRTHHLGSAEAREDPVTEPAVLYRVRSLRSRPVDVSRPHAKTGIHFIQNFFIIQCSRLNL